MILHLKKVAAACAVVAGFSSVPAHASGIPVIDAAAVAQAMQQVVAWGKQYQQMVDQLTQMQRQFNSANGIRNMAGIANNPATRNYLPQEYQDILRNGVGQWQAIYDAAKQFDLAGNSSQVGTKAVEFFDEYAKQAALNRASAEEGYKSASTRFNDIQTLLDRINSAPEEKDIADLQARIQAESVMMQNEANKLAALQYAAQAQRDLQAQRSAEMQMQSLNVGLPADWR